MRLRWGLEPTILRRAVGLALIVTFAGVGVARPAWAHGGGVPQLTNAEAGPYRVSAWTLPDPIRVGEMHVSVAISEPPAPGTVEEGMGDLVLDAQVRVQLEPVAQPGEGLVTFATREEAVNKLFYETDVDLPSEGQWQVNILVEGPAGSGKASFELRVLPASTFNTLRALPPLWVAGGVGLALLTAGWLVRSFRTRDAYRRAPRASQPSKVMELHKHAQDKKQARIG